MSVRIGRRTLLSMATTASLGAAARAAGAKPAAPAKAVMPVLYVSHAAPLFVENDGARISALNAWGQTLPRPTGIIAMTPHFAARRPAFGATGRGVALRNLPPAFADRIAPELRYETPPSDALARRVTELTSIAAAPDRHGFDHTTWMPLACLFVKADVPVLEITYPYQDEEALVAFGRKLAPLRDEGVLFMASGGITHNLAMASPAASGGPVPAWTKAFDAWAAERIEARDLDALLDWRAKAPDAEVAHPDDGAHFRVLLVAIGFALGSAAGFTRARSPIVGFDGPLSKRCIELG